MTDPSTSPPGRRIAIVGGGCSGTLVAAQLLIRASAGTRIMLIERNPPAGRGVAYGTDFNDHRLNVPVEKMSAWANEPDHFLAWASQRAGHLGYPDSIQRGDFLPRWIFARYLDAVLQEAKSRAAAGVIFELIVGEAVDLEDGPSGPKLTLADGRTIAADAVVLALGLLPGEYPIRRPLPIYHSPRYLHSPLLPTALSGVAKDDDLLIVGAGLTAVDIIVQCRRLGIRGVIHALSRRGLRPLPHRPPGAPHPPFLTAENLPATCREVLARTRAEARSAAARGLDWRPVVDSLRPLTPGIWQRWSTQERSRFLRLLRPFWEVHRHRIPPETAAITAEMETTGRLKYHAGRLQSLREGPNGVAALIKLRGQEEFVALRVAKVINCTGPRTDYSKYQHPLLINLLAAGLIGHDPLALGVSALPNGQVCRYGGEPVKWLFTLGAPMKGVLWESTAVPEIRVQAQRLAEQILA